MTEPSVARPSLLRARLTAGKPSFGVIATMPSVQSVQVLADAGVDWLLIDMEHSPIDLSSAHAMIMATSGTTTIPMVRIPWANHWQAKTIMDLGALGVVVPMINTPEQAEAAVRSFRYPPAGNRLWGPFYAPMRWQQSMSEYIATANENILAIVTVEHPDAVRNIDEISRFRVWTSRSSGRATWPWPLGSLDSSTLQPSRPSSRKPRPAY